MYVVCTLYLCSTPQCLNSPFFDHVEVVETKNVATAAKKCPGGPLEGPGGGGSREGPGDAL